MFKIIITLFLIISCSSLKNQGASYPDAPKDFSPRELITTTALLTKIYDEQHPPLTCVPDADSSELLIRTLRPRLEVVIDDIEAVLDQDHEINSLVNNCQSDCTCEFLDEIFREHQLTLNKAQIKVLKKGISANEKVCLPQRASTFCDGPLFKELDKEKEDFRF